MIRVFVAFCLLQFLLYAQSSGPAAPKYINSIFAQKGGLDIFFYNVKNKSTFLQKQNLATALYSEEFEAKTVNQLGVFFTDHGVQPIDDGFKTSQMGLKLKNKVVEFGGVEFSNSYIDSFHENPFYGKSPSFMLTIKKQGDSLKIGGNIKDVPFKDWSDTFLKKYDGSQQ